MNEHASKTYTMTPPPGRKRRIWLRLLLSLLILVCGIVIGAGATLVVVHRTVVGFLHNPDRMSERMARHMERKLRLTDGQKAQVEAVLKRRIDALLDIRRDIRPRVAEQIDLLEQEMRDVLTDDQMREWKSQLNRIKEILLAPDKDDGT